MFSNKSWEHDESNIAAEFSKKGTSISKENIADCIFDNFEATKFQI